MRKLWLTFTAMLLCSIASFAQTEIWTASGFLDSVGTSGNYKLMADINLGDLGARTASIKSSFSGTFYGNGKTITYQAKFTGSGNNDNFSLFGSVSGTIDSLNLNGSVTLSGTGNSMNVALLCGMLSNNGTIEYCNVSGNVNSTVTPATEGYGSNAGLIVGTSSGTVRYCIGTGNVVGVGYVGGLIGQMNGSASVLACSFTGSVKANNPSSMSGAGFGSYAGGICGAMRAGAELSFCVVNADIQSGKRTSGVASTAGNAWQIIIGDNVSITLTNSYASGNLNGEVIGEGDFTNTTNTTNISGNFYKNYPNKTPEQICADLEDAREDESHTEFYFDVRNGEVILVIGQRSACETPTNLQVNITGHTATINWDAPAGAERFLVTQANGQSETVTGTTVDIENLQPGTTYIVSVQTVCGNNSYSEPVSISFTTECPIINGLTVNNITHETATATWTSTEPTTFTVRLYVYEGDNINPTPIYTTITESQTQASINLSPLDAATQYTIEVVASCGTNADEANHSIQTFTTEPADYVTAQTGNFSLASTWEGGKVPSGRAGTTITIKKEHIVTLDITLVLEGTIINNGVLRIAQQGQLINTTDVPGIIEIVSAPKANQAWTFIGAPFDNYVLGCILPESHDVSVKKYDYTEGGWSDSWAHIGTPMNAGEGYFAFPFLDAPITFTTYGDVGTYEDRGNIGYTSTNTVTDLNINNVEVSLPSECPNNWMALSNPYPAKLKVSKFLEENGSKLQGNCVYVFRDGTFDQGNITTGDIAMTEGFFVNFANNAGDKTITFNKGQLSYNNPNSAKASANEFIKLTLINGNKKVRAYLAHNENAEQGYDIFDANKLFAPTEIAEPYFVTDGIELMKEEFAELPYYATMNVRSFANDTVSFVVNNIPEGLAVSIIDGENVIDMVEGGVYTTEILTGENADRFKVLIKKNLGIADVEELEVNITNNNRHISIETTETDLQVEVYNALGQKVLSTKDRNFTLNQVSAGAYLIKAFNNKASKTQKIVVE